MNINRRNFLKGTAAGAAGTALAGGVLIGGAHADANAATATAGPADEASYPFHGAAPVRRAHPRPVRQAGVHLRRGLRLDGGGQGRAWPTCCRRSPPGPGSSPPAGPRPTSASASRRRTATCSARSIPADGLTATLSVGSTLFDDRYGLAARKPRKLTPMTAFPNDSPEPGLARAATCCCSCAPTTPTRSTTRSGTSPSTPAAACSCAGRSRATTRRPARRAPSRNLLGFKDGTANPTGATAPAT